MESIVFKKLNDDAIIPTRGTPQSAGFDLVANHDATIEGGQGNVIVKTGIGVQLPDKTYGRIAMRSGLAVKEHLSVSAGVVDQDYAGDIGVVVYCTKMGHTYTIKKGDRFAQLVPEMVSDATSSQSQMTIDAWQTSHRFNRQSLTTLEEWKANHEGWGSTGK